MFSKNIKILSLFLILAVVMIGALGAVSAANTYGTNSTATVTPGTSNNYTVDTAGGHTASITANATTTDTELPINATVTDTDGVPSVTDNFAQLLSDNHLYYKNASDAYVDSGATIAPVAGAITDGRVYTFTLNITSNQDKLTSGTTYYLNTSFANAAVAYSGETGALSVYNITSGANYYVSFLYTAPTITLSQNVTNITYGDAWTYTGYYKDAAGNPIAYATVTVTSASGTKDIYTDSEGKFVYNSTMYGTDIPVSAKSIEFAAPAATTTATINVVKKNLTSAITLNTTSIDYGATIDAIITLYSNGTLFNVSDNTVYTTYKIVDSDGNSILKSTNLVDIKEGVLNITTAVNSANLKPATYYIIVDSNSITNYNVKGTTATFTVNAVATTLNANATSIVDTDTGINAQTIKFVVNSTNGNGSLTGTGAYVLYDANNVPITTGSTTAFADGSATLALSTLDSYITTGNTYTLVVKYPAQDGYNASTVTITITDKAANVIDANATTFAYGTTNSSAVINVTSSPVKNTTLNVYNGKELLGTVTIVNGTGNYNASSLPAGKYNITFAYAGDDTYNAYNKTVVVTVTATRIGNLTADPTKIINLTLNSNATISLNLTNATNASQIITYTGEVEYYVNGTAKGNISMVNGTVTFDANTLNGLKNGKNNVTFKINTNDDSTTAAVMITAYPVNTTISADNITTNNATGITVTGTVANATEGTVTVTIKDAKNNTVATVYNVLVSSTGAFTASLGALDNGNYTAEINYTSTSGLSNAATKNITVIVNGTAPTPTPVGNITTVLTLNNFTEVVGAGQNLTGTLTDVNGTPIVGQHVALNLTNPKTGASKIYWVTTDTDGAFQLQINLAVGTYTASASYAGNSYDNVNFTAAGPVAATITVTNGTEPVDNRTAVVLTVNNFTSNVTGQNLTGTLFANGTPIIGQKIALNLTNPRSGASKIYWANTDTDGAIQLEINLAPGSYTFTATYDGTSVYQSANAAGTIVRT